MDKPVKAPKLSITERKVVKAKIQAELTDTPQTVLAKQVFPNATPASAGVMMSRELKKVNVQEALEIALAEYDLTPNRLAGVVDEAMSATKTVVIGKDEDAFADQIPDHSIRLKAAGMAAQWMGVGKGELGGGSIHFHQHVEDKKSAYDD